MLRDLRHDVRRCAKAVNAEALRRTGFDQRTVPNQPGAEQGSGLGVGIVFGNWKTKSFIGDGKFRVAAVQRVAGETRAVAKILAFAAAKFALAARPAQPRNAHAIADFESLNAFAFFDDDADNFVSGHERKFWIGKLAVHDVQIRAADGAGGHLHQNLRCIGLWRGNIRCPQWLPRRFQNHCAHELIEQPKT